MIKYFIYWKSLLTEATGRGKCVFSKEVAEDIVKQLDEKYPGEILHYAVSEPE